MIKRTVIFIVLLVAIWTAETVYYSAVQPQVSTQLSVDALNGGNAEANNLRVAQQVHNEVPLVAGGLTLGAGLLCYGSYIKRGIAASKKEITNA